MTFRNAARRLSVGIATIVLLSACADGSRVVPVTDRSLYPRQSAGAASDQYIVRSGDTLYSVARRFGEDHQELADRNKIKPPFDIRVGQRLDLAPRKTTAMGSSSYSATAAESGAAARPDADVFALPAATTVTTPDSIPLPVPVPDTVTARIPDTVMQPEAESALPPGKATMPAPIAAPRNGKWLWPAKGKVARRSPAASGLDIIGERGQEIVAAAPGRVVYGGSGLRGYGKLIIIKHNDEFLSAYAHNDKLLVHEGQHVQQGQKIAEMGMSGTDRVKLHFQIRRNGAPVDPLKFLPAH